VVKAFAQYRPVESAVWRVSAFTSIPADRWPGRDGSSEQWRAWIAGIWAFPGVAEAITQASSALASQVMAVNEGCAREDRHVSRVGYAVARYLVRMRTRATPFGLFAGVAPLRFGAATAIADRGQGCQLRLRANGAWVAAVIMELEASASLLRYLLVSANDLVVVRGRRLHVAWQPHCADPGRSRPVEVSLRYTAAVAVALDAAKQPIAAVDLMGKVREHFPSVETTVVESMIGQLVATGALISQLRPPSTETDPLGHVLRVLDGVDLTGEPAVRSMRLHLQAVHAALGPDAPSDAGSRARLAARMRAITARTDQPLGIDLGAAEAPSMSRRVAAETAKAVETLLLLSWAPTGLPEWREYHGRFLERYGAGALVPVLDLVDPAAGLGYPRHFATAPARRQALWTGRDERLVRLAQQAALDGVTEVELTGADVAALADDGTGDGRYGPAHLDATLEVRARSVAAVDDGEFTVAITGLGRSISALSGRFLDLLPGHQQELLAAVPTIIDGATVMQLSFPPHRAATESVTRVPQLLPEMISVAEHRPHAEAVLRLRDLAVCADLDRMYVVMLRGRGIVEPIVTCAAALHTMPPVVRLLLELPRATGAALSLFDWGAAAQMPFLPRLRYGRTIISPARWQLRPETLPGPQIPQDRWEAAFGQLQQRLRLPDVLAVGSGDQKLRLAVHDPMDQALLRAHLDRATGPVTVTEAPGPEEFGWCTGRAHEIVVPLVRTGPAARPAVAQRLVHRPVVELDHGQFPGAAVLFGKLYGSPEAFSTIIAEHLPQLYDNQDDAMRWWFVRYRDPYPHLRLRQITDDFGRDAARLGRWAAHLRHLRLVGDLVLDTYQPEIARYGTGPAMRAAEDLFVADSAAAAAQLAAARGPSDLADAITAVSHLDLLTGLLGSRNQAIRWLIDRPGSLPRPPGDHREARRQAIHLAEVSGIDADDAIGAAAGGARIAVVWARRRTAAQEYVQRLAADPAAPAADEVAMSLLHLHHNRAVGIDPDREARIYHLTRAVALAAAARSTAPAQVRS
jgi:thiopeptide-type bacteriocin biosynthesis protein